MPDIRIVHVKICQLVKETVGDKEKLVSKIILNKKENKIIDEKDINNEKRKIRQSLGNPEKVSIFFTKLHL